MKSGRAVLPFVATEEAIGHIIQGNTQPFNRLQFTFIGSDCLATAKGDCTDQAVIDNFMAMDGKDA